MKERILTFIIGVLVGAIISTAVFLIINKTGSKTKNTNTGRMMQGRPEQSQMGGEFPEGEMPNGEMPTGDKTLKGNKNKSNTNNQNTTSTDSPTNQQTETTAES